jgi:SAM-dependent methyltransferase
VRLDDAALVASEYATDARLRRRASAFTAGDVQRVAVEAIAEAQPRRVLEVGCGWGELAARVAAETGAEVVAVDVSPRMVELARQRGVDARVGDVQQLELADGEFDCALAAWMLYHVPDLERGIAELARVLRPGGRLALATWDPEPDSFTRALFSSIAEAGAVPPPSLPPGPPFFQYAPDPEFVGLLSGAGLVDVSVSSIAFTHHVDDLDAFWADLVAGAVRASVLIRAQPADVQGRIRRTYGDAVAGWRVAGGWDLACAVKVGAGTKPR